MIKKLAVPALMLAMAAFGCSSSTTPTTGTGGSGGHATGGTAVAGHPGGGTSGGGTSGGGTSGGGTSGGGTSRRAAPPAAAPPAAVTQVAAPPAAAPPAAARRAAAPPAAAPPAAVPPVAAPPVAVPPAAVRRGWRERERQLHRDGLSVRGRTALSARRCSATTWPRTAPACRRPTAPSFVRNTYAGTQHGGEHCQSYHLCWGVEGKATHPGADPDALPARRRRRALRRPVSERFKHTDSKAPVPRGTGRLFLLTDQSGRQTALKEPRTERCESPL